MLPESTPTLNAETDAAPILERMQTLLSEAQVSSDAALQQRLRDELIDVRRQLLEVVVARYGGNRDAAAESDDFEPEFRQMTAFINPPKKISGRSFPGVQKRPQRER